MEIKTTTIDKIIIPEILYKYRDCDNEYHKRILTHNELYIPSPKEFEDEYDCKLPLSVNGCNLEDNIKFRNAFFDKMNQTAGVTCFTANFNNSKMWEKYGANHKGFIVGYNTSVIRKLDSIVGTCGEVVYYDEIPQFSIVKNPPMEDIIELITKQISTKLKSKWDFEQEYRLFKIQVENRIVKLPNEAYAEIIFGANMTTENRVEIQRIIKDKFPHMKIKE